MPERRPSCCQNFSSYFCSGEEENYDKLKRKLKETLESNVQATATGARRKKRRVAQATDLTMAPSKFYEEVDFCNRDLSWKNVRRFF